MRRPLTYAAVLLVFVGLPLCTRSQDEIKKRQVELENIRDQLREFEAKIKEQQYNEHEALELLDTYDRKATLVRRLITKLRKQEQDLQQKIDGSRKAVDKLEGQLAFLKAHYAHYVASVYKSGRTHDLELLLSSTSINQFYIRTEYLKRFTAQRKRDATTIAAKKQEVEDSQAQLQQQLSEQRRLIAEKASEEDRLASLAADRRRVLSQIRKDKKLVQREINRQMKAAKDLENMIASLIEADRIRKEREAERARKLKLPQPPAIAGAFELKKGKLRWPVSEGIVVARFGNRQHPTLKTITQNLGIDIAVKTGSSVLAVADAEVGKIWWLPSYGNLVILDHANGYLTVYTHLAEIHVTEGQKVKEGDIIAESGESLDGPRLHFELWKDRTKQDPEQWLMRH